ncbi:MAG: hypothetical protein AAF657_41655, partial [Acidobacteriota bacterium]
MKFKCILHLAVVFSLWTGAAGRAAGQGDPVLLEAGALVERQIEAEEVHVYTFEPGVDRRLLVEQRGVDVEVVAIDVFGQRSSTLNGPLGRFDTEILRLDPQIAQIEVVPFAGGVTSGRYALRFHPPDDESASGGALRRRAEAFLSEAAALPLDAEAGVLRQAAELYTLA